MQVLRDVRRAAALLILFSGAAAAQDSPASRPESAPAKYDADPPRPIASEPKVHYDYDIVYVRAPRFGDDRQIAWSDVFAPYRAEPGSDLMLLHPDGREEVLVKAGNDAVSDVAVSFDAKWVYYALFHYAAPTAANLLQPKSSDIYKIELSTKKIVRLTNQEFTPNTGTVDGSRRAPGVFNLGPCPAPGGKVVFTSTRNGFVASKNYKGFSSYEEFTRDEFKTSQLFRMDEDGGCVEPIGSMSMNSALSPVILKDGRIAFSSFEAEGMRDARNWAIWTIYPDGTHWAPLVSALGTSAEVARHFAAQRSDGRVVIEQYYLQQNHGFGTYFDLEPSAPAGEPFFGSADPEDPRNLEVEKFGRTPFTPRGMRLLTPFAYVENRPARQADASDPNSPRLGKFTHPAPAPDRHLLTVWSPGPVYGIVRANLHGFMAPAIDSGIYLFPDGEPLESPAGMLLIKNDPKYNEKWPHAVVPYRRIYGVDEPAAPPPADPRGRLEAGSPFGYFGAASLYKRESYPRGKVASGSVTATASKTGDAHEGLGGIPWGGIIGNWFAQGADAGRYSNDDIHALRVLITEPTTDPALAGRTSRLWWNAANERFRILGEFPVRKFNGTVQPVDPDGNPDTSFLAKLPADAPWTIQTLDRDGMVLNMAQTWHMLRPGEARTDCGGCHAHSQRPTPFEETEAGRSEKAAFDLTASHPRVTAKAIDASGRKWDASDATGLRFEPSPFTVEYKRDVKPILERSCTACHTKNWEKPAAELVLDDNRPAFAEGPLYDLLLERPPLALPGSFQRLAADPTGKHGRRMNLGSKLYPNLWTLPQGSRYVRFFQSRRSLLVWKINGKRLDGFSNDDFAVHSGFGETPQYTHRGEPVDPKNAPADRRGWVDLAYLGEPMPPPSAVEGTFTAPDGKKIKVPPLSDEDRRTIARWIDLGCPIDLAGPRVENHNNGGWFDDECRPAVTIAVDAQGVLKIGMCDVGSGLDPATFELTADCTVAGKPAGARLEALCAAGDGSVWSLPLGGTPSGASSALITASVADRAGNRTSLQRRVALTAGAR